jgi:hypothetical protein
LLKIQNSEYAIFDDYQKTSCIMLFGKFQYYKNGMHQVGPNCNFIQNFSSLAVKGETVGVTQISADGGGT